MLEKQSPFDALAIREGGGEFWSARDLMPYLGYKRWERFVDALDRAKTACMNSGHDSAEHFRGAAKPSKGGNGAVQMVEDFHLTRYAAYLVAMNGDPRKPEIAAAQTYFAVKTREAETGTPVLSLVEAQDPMLVALQSIIGIRQGQLEQQRQINTLHLRVQAVEDRQHEAAESALALPAPSEDAPELSETAKCRMAVDSLVSLTGRSHHDIWKEVYSQYDYRVSTKLTAKVENFNKSKPAKDRLTKLEYIARFGKIGILYSIILVLIERARPHTA